MMDPSFLLLSTHTQVPHTDAQFKQDTREYVQYAGTLLLPSLPLPLHFVRREVLLLSSVPYMPFSRGACNTACVIHIGKRKHVQDLVGVYEWEDSCREANIEMLEMMK